MAIAAAAIGGVGHALTMQQPVNVKVVLLAAAVTFLVLTILPWRLLGPWVLAAVLAANQAAIHVACMWRSEPSTVGAAQHVHLFQANGDPAMPILPMLLVHTIAMIVGVLVLRQAERILWRWASQSAGILIARVRATFAAAPRHSKHECRVSLPGHAVPQHQSRTVAWSRNVTGRRGPPRALRVT